MEKVVLSDKAKALKPGVYRHYSGKKYKVLGVAFHSETLEELIIYRALYGKKYFWVRPIKMFQEKVMFGGKFIKRFKYLRK